MRIDFSKKTRVLVASRSGYQCSFPGCSQITIGPGARLSEFSATGVAAHIYSASTGGPRGQGRLGEKELKAPSNAIWLCQHHAKLVDNNRGDQYPPAVLLSYKALHEARTARAHRGIFSPFAWFHQLLVKHGPVFRTPAKIHFGKLTFLLGDNGTGKSALWQWLAGMSDPVTLTRWRRQLRQDQPLSFEVTYFSPDQHVVELELTTIGGINYSLDGRSVPFNPLVTKFITTESEYEFDDNERERWKEADTIERLAMLFHVDPLLIENILPQAQKNSRFLRKLSIQENETEEETAEAEETKSGRYLAVEFEGSGASSYGMLSHGEQEEVKMAIGLALAQFWSEYMPTVLVFSHLAMDLSRIKDWANRLGTTNDQFQTVIELAMEPESFFELNSIGAEFVYLEGKPPNVKIQQAGQTNS